jgi:hypothetical protein
MEAPPDYQGPQGTATYWEALWMWGETRVRLLKQNIWSQLRQLTARTWVIFVFIIAPLLQLL